MNYIKTHGFELMCNAVVALACVAFSVFVYSVEPDLFLIPLIPIFGMAGSIMFSIVGHWTRNGTLCALLSIGLALNAPASQEVRQIPVMAGENSPLIVGAVCVAIVVGIGGKIVIKVIDKCIDLKVHQLTNNVADFANVTGGGQSCGCTNSSPYPFPAPITIEQSDGLGGWTTVAEGVSAGEEFELNDGVTLRSRVLSIKIRDDGVLDVPPGTLERSEDLKKWTPMFASAFRNLVVAKPGTFYRVR